MKSPSKDPAASICFPMQISTITFLPEVSVKSNKVIFSKKIDGIEIIASFDDEVYTPEQSKSMIAEFVYMLTNRGENNV